MDTSEKTMDWNDVMNADALTWPWRFLSVGRPFPIKLNIENENLRRFAENGSGFKNRITSQLVSDCLVVTCKNYSIPLTVKQVFVAMRMADLEDVFSIKDIYGHVRKHIKMIVRKQGDHA